MTRGLRQRRAVTGVSDLGTLRPELACPSCFQQGLALFHELDRIPVHSCRLLSTRAEAKSFPRGSLRLGFCPGCGFISNTAFDPSVQDYGESYEETQGFSPRFRAFAHDLAARLVEKYDLGGKELFEIGCGKGEFLVDMCELADARGVGIDPSVVPERIESRADGRVTFIRDLYSEKYGHLTGDFLICRHTLEHIQPVGEFLRLVRRSLESRPATVVFFELPETMRVLREVAFWDVYYEHCSYFTPGSLARLFRQTGFEVLDLALDFDDQYILLEASPTADAQGEALELEEEPEDVADAVRHFRSGFARTLAQWKDELGRVRAAGGRAVIWGSGSKGVSFLTTLAIDDEVEYVVDINPYKHGKYMAGTGQEIVPPAFLREYQPDLVIAMNPIYLDEIQRDLDRMDVRARLVAV